MANDDPSSNDPNDPHVTGARGGKARAAAMTAEQRSEAARLAVKARWNVPRATHEGVFEFGTIRIDCAVLEGGIRVVSERAFTRALGRANAGGQTYARRGSAADQLPIYLTLSNLKPVIPSGFSVPTFRYRMANNNALAIGIRAESIPDVCDIWIEAKERRLLRKDQLPTAKAAGVISRGLSRVGIVALIDEVTGYQADRDRDELQTILKAYVLPEMQPWLRRFPPEFTDETFRLMGWKRNAKSIPTTQTPRFMGKVINECIYKRLPAPVLPELQRVNPAVNGHRRAKHHQHLTPDTGIPHLDRQIVAVMALMRGARDRRQFAELLVRAFPVSGDQMPLGTATDIE